MARQRMINPRIWESFSFAELSDLAKILFISLISHADDEGRGIAGAAYLKNITFPHDETRRVAEVQKALSEIALHTSTQFYLVNGREYYALTNWTEYQKVEKPSKSKLPPPPSVGEGGELHSRQLFGEDSGNVRGTFGEDSGNKEKRKEKNINITHNARMREEESFHSEEEELKELPSADTKQFSIFTERWGIAVDSYSPLLHDMDFNELDAAYARSKKFLQQAPVAKFLSWVIKNYSSIVKGKYDDREKKEEKKEIKLPWKKGDIAPVTKAGEG